MRKRIALVLAVLALGACRPKPYATMQSPVEALVADAREGSGSTARLRRYFTARVDDKTLQESLSVVAAAVKQFGEPRAYQVVANIGAQATIRVCFTNSSETAPSFKAHVEEEDGKWNISGVELEILRAAVESASGSGIVLIGMGEGDADPDG